MQVDLFHIETEILDPDIEACFKFIDELNISEKNKEMLKQRYKVGGEGGVIYDRRIKKQEKIEQSEIAHMLDIDFENLRLKAEQQTKDYKPMYDEKSNVEWWDEMIERITNRGVIT
jgi:hypothetical protein